MKLFGKIYNEDYLLVGCTVLYFGRHVSVTVRLSLNFIIGCWGYTLDREDRVSGETSVTILHSSWKSRDHGKNDTGKERERERERE
jgi:hypothetical protein